MYVHGIFNELDDAAGPFRNAIDFMQRENRWDLARAICEGIDEKDCCKLFEELSGFVWKTYQDTTPRNGARPDRLEGLKQLLEDGVKAVVVSLVRYENRRRKVIHYTVVTDLSSTGLTIHDSQGKTITRNGNSLQYDGEEVSLGYFFVMQPN